MGSEIGADAVLLLFVEERVGKGAPICWPAADCGDELGGWVVSFNEAEAFKVANASSGLINLKSR